MCGGVGGALKYFSSKLSSLECVVFSDAITDVQIELPMEAPIQGQLYNLTCNVAGPADYVYWVKDEQMLQAENQIIFSADNKTIMFNPLQNSHSGRYHCYAMNLVSVMGSPLYLLLVNCE